MAGKKMRSNSSRKAYYTNYKSQNTREKNKAYKLLRILRNDPENKTAQVAFEKLSDSAIKHARSRYQKELKISSK